VIAAAGAAGLLLAAGSASGQTITSKRAQAEAIVAEVDGLNGNLEQTIEDYNYANLQLANVDRDLTSNAKHLVAAKKSLVVAQRRIGVRARDLYINGEGDSTLEVLLGSSSLDDIIARLDAIERVSSQDSQILRTVKTYRKEVETRRETLQDKRADQARIVAEQAAQKQSIESQIAEQNQLLASVKDEITQMRAEEARQQAALAAQARRSSMSRSRPTTRLSSRPPTTRTSPPLATAVSSGSHSSTSECPTSGAARARRRDSTAPAS
jgi:peptidoglycan hydrolase CwlO-like protein